MRSITHYLLGGILMACVSTQAHSVNWAVKMADSEMKRFPQLYQFDYGSRLHFGYTQGLGGTAFMKLWKATGHKAYFDYVYQWGDTLVGKNGSIYSYKRTDYTLDFINSGKVLFDLYEETREPRFRIALDTLIKQFDGQPRTSEGGFWHKLIYPHQMWLDGLYMASPFMARYGASFGQPSYIDEAVHQLVLVAKHTYDVETGLFYHGWDESRTQRWADPVSGHSPCFWGRSIGWYAMALVDALDYIPANHPERATVIRLFRVLSEGMLTYQDKKTGLWYQVVDQDGRAGNYREASVSCMMMYAYAKGVNKGYLPGSYRKAALRALEGIKKELLVIQADGTISITHCCAVAGLGGNPYRDGSYEYYIHEKIRDNDGKATASFIMGCLELGK